VKISLLSILCSLPLLIGCNKLAKEVILDGSIFIVTEGRENIKMGLVAVSIYPEADAQEVLKSIEQQIAVCKQRIAAAQELDAQAVVKRSEADAIVNTPEAKALQDEIRALPQGAYKLPEIEKKFAEFTTKQQALLHESSNLRFEAEIIRKTIPTVEQSWAVVLAALPPISFAVKTDADGKFSVKLPNKGHYVIVAESSRLIPTEREIYRWLVTVKLPNEHDQPVILSNDNLFMKENSLANVKLRTR
jgi:hypothetical protein